jgi:hypothetical protein
MYIQRDCVRGVSKLGGGGGRKTGGMCERQ